MKQSTREFIERSQSLRAVTEVIGLYRSDHVAAKNNVVGSRINVSNRGACNAVVGSRLRINFAGETGIDL